MASGMQFPAPPRTPSPLLDGYVTLIEPSLEAEHEEDQSPAAFEAAVSPPMHEHLLSPEMAVSPRRLRPAALLTSANGMPTASSKPSEDQSPDPFKFETVVYTVPRSPVKSNVGQRRGHKYKHSSISHQIFLEPTRRAPLQLPASLPIPTLKEGWTSMSREQTLRGAWCFCHLFISAYVQWSGQGSLAMTALSHLIFYDAVGATLCAVTDVLSNFEVWKRSSIRQPFGLERSEVLAGFAMSILLLFMGFDLITHNLKHVLEDLGDHEAHHEHQHNRVSPGSVDLVSLLAIASTLVSAIMLQNHKRIAKAMRFAALEPLPSVLNNPSHLLTLICSASLLFMPLLSLEMYNWLDRALSGAIACAMLTLGFRLVWTLGAMLLMSYSGAGVSEVKRDIATDPSVVALDEASFWQVHYGLCLASLKLTVRGTDDSLARLRKRLISLVKQRLGGGYGTGGQRWEISVQLTLEQD